jgi:hypothetical protein
MRMLLKFSVLAMSAAGFLAAQHGGGGHFSGGGGGGFHASAPASRSFSSGYSGGGYSSSYRAVVPPASYGGHLTYSTPGMPGTYGNSVRYGQSVLSGSRPVGGRPPLRPPIRRPGGYPGYPYYGFGLYPYLGLGYYGDGYGYDPYYDSGSGVPYQDQYAPQYEPMMDPAAAYPPAYPPVPYAPYPDQQQPLTQGVISEPEAPSVPITIILKSGQKLIVQNYAIVNGMFWDFTKPNGKRFPIASIDVAASAKATDEAGGAFPEVFFATNPK